MGVVEGATENAATVQALPDNLIKCGLDPEGCYLFIVDGAKALRKALRRTFGADIPIQRCLIHKARNITDRLPPKHHAAVRRALKQAWELNDVEKAELPDTQSGTALRARGTGCVSFDPGRPR